VADALDRFREILLKANPDLRPEQIDPGILRARFEMGGTECGYIAKRPALLKQHALGQSLQQGVAPKEAMQRAGVRKSWGYELMGRKVRR
jgi:hypothetical protein